MCISKVIALVGWITLQELIAIEQCDVFRLCNIEYCLRQFEQLGVATLGRSPAMWVYQYRCTVIASQSGDKTREDFAEFVVGHATVIWPSRLEVRLVLLAL